MIESSESTQNENAVTFVVESSESTHPAHLARLLLLADLPQLAHLDELFDVLDLLLRQRVFRAPGALVVEAELPDLAVGMSVMVAVPDDLWGDFPGVFSLALAVLVAFVNPSSSALLPWWAASLRSIFVMVAV